MKVIGLTGGIGSGKSFVAGVAEKYFPVLHVNTDEIARLQMKKGGISYQKTVDYFSAYSEKLLGEDGEIDRKVLSEIVLSDKKLLEKLNGITHPAVVDEVKNIIKREKEYKNHKAVLIETALLYEAGIDSICDEIWYVYAPDETRRKRLTLSRGYTKEKTDMFMSRQNSEELFLRLADRTVPNGADVTEEDMKKIISGYLNSED